MIPLDHTHEILVSLIGAIIVMAALIKALFRRLGVPALVGFIVLGLLLRLGDEHWGLLNHTIRAGLQSLADLGLVALLFRVGLSADARGLLRKLPSASVIWVGDVTVSGSAGFIAAHYALGLGLTTSLVVATALTATSVGVSISAWDEAGLLGSSNGQTLIDVAELDDISAIALMALVFSVLPVLGSGANGDPWSAAAQASGTLILKLIFFTALCYLFAHYAERRLTHVVAVLEAPPERMLTVVGIGFMITAIAAWLGFSLAIGALFAGLVFSRDPVADRTRPAFENLYDFFTPFFFIGIGLQIDPAALGEGVGLGVALLAAAIAGKVLGAGLPARLSTDWRGATMIGLSMVPRAEIAMVVLTQARQLGPDFVTEGVYAGMVLVTAGTSILAPMVVRPGLRRLQEAEKTP